MVDAIIPVKTIELSKSRLSASLNPSKRIALVQALILHTVDVVVGCGCFRTVYVASKDQQVFHLIRKFSIRAWEEPRTNELNESLNEIMLEVAKTNADSCLIFPIDLPYLTKINCIRLTESLADQSIIIVPDRQDRGTNILGMKPPGAISACFGENSFQKHIQDAQKNHLRVVQCVMPELSIDLDAPEDIADLDWSKLAPYLNKKE